MFGSNVLDVAIGLAFFYLLLSLLVTGINELLETKLTRRAKDLEAGIYELLGGGADSTTPPPTWYGLFTGIFPKNLRWLGIVLCWPTWLLVRWFVDIKAYSRDSNLPPASASQNVPPANANKHVENFYNHPLIFSLFSGNYVPRGRNLPSYIPSQMFALALLDLVRRGVTSQDTLEFSHSSAQLPVPLNEFSIPPAGYSHSQPGDASLVIQLRFDIAHTNAISERTRQVLLALIDNARGDLSKAQQNIEDWFNHAMDRVSGWYKRRMQWITAVIGLILAVALNADSFAVADSLSRDPALRASVTSAADAYLKTPTAAKTENAIEDVSQKINTVQGFGWPVGWDRDPRRIPDLKTCDFLHPDQDRLWRGIGAWLLKALGWVVTVFAISLGAPFWFDTLNKIIQFRSSIKPPPPKEQGSPTPK